MSLLSKFSVKKLSIIQTPNKEIKRCCFLADRNAIAVCLTGGEIRIFDFEQGKVVKTLNSKADYPWRLVASRNGRYIAVLDESRKLGCTQFGTVEVWDVEEGKMLLSLHAEHSLASVAVTSDGSRLAVGRLLDMAVEIYELPTGDLLHVSSGLGDNLLVPDGVYDRGKVETLDYSPDDQYLVSAGDDGKVFLWDFRSGKGIQKQKFDHAIIKACFSHSGKRIATAGEDSRMVAVHEVFDKYAQMSFFFIGKHPLHRGPVFTRDDKRIVVSDGNGKLWIWLGKRTAKQVRHNFGYIDALSQDGTKVAASKDGVLGIWDISQLIR